MPTSIHLLSRPRERYEPDMAALVRAGSIEPFIDAAARLSTEFVQISADLVAAPTARPAGRDGGILRGLAVRTIKLIDRLVEETLEGRGDVQVLLTRLADETVVNLGWLLQGGADRFDTYVWDGIEAPRKRRQIIEEEMQRRSGLVLPIEDRMLRAIESEITLGEVDLSSPPARRRLPGMEERMRSVFPEADKIYDFSWRVGSAAVHGAWKDLLDRHVSTDGTWTPLLAWREADPVVLFGTLAWSTVVFVTYTQELGLSDDFRPLYVDLAARAEQVDEAYRSFAEGQRGS